MSINKPRTNHVLELAKELNVEPLLFEEAYYYDEEYEWPIGTLHGKLSAGSALPGRIIVTCWKESCQDAYFTALHELGHCYHGHNTFGGVELYNEDLLLGEAQAWIYAFETSLEKPTKEVAEGIMESWVLYMVCRDSMTGVPQPELSISKEKEDVKKWEAMLYSLL